MRGISSATTRSTHTGVRTLSAPPLLREGVTLTSPESRVSYAIGRLLGQGGFGQVYLVRRVSDSPDIPETLCIKVSERIDAWLREAYFGQLLDGHPRAIRVFDAFPSL